MKRSKTKYLFEKNENKNGLDNETDEMGSLCSFVLGGASGTLSFERELRIGQNGPLMGWA